MGELRKVLEEQDLEGQLINKTNDGGANGSGCATKCGQVLGCLLFIGVSAGGAAGLDAGLAALGTNILSAHGKGFLTEKQAAIAAAAGGGIIAGALAPCVFAIMFIGRGEQDSPPANPAQGALVCAANVAAAAALGAANVAAAAALGAAMFFKEEVAVAAAAGAAGGAIVGGSCGFCLSLCGSGEG